MTDHPFALIQGNKIIRKSFMQFPAREIGEVRESVEDSIRFFEKRFADLHNSLMEISAMISKAENKGSFLQKIIHMRENLHSRDAIGDFDLLYQEIERIEKELQGIVQKNKLRNFDIKSSYLSELKSLVDHYDIREAGRRIAEIQNIWIRTGKVIDEREEDLEREFRESIAYYYHRRDQFFKDQETLKNDHLKNYQELLARTEKLLDELEPLKAFQKLKELQKGWKETGGVDANDYNLLNTRFMEIGRLVFQRYTDFQAKSKGEAKIRIDKIKTSKISILKSIDNINYDLIEDLEGEKGKLVAAWKKSGNVFNNEIKELNEQFSNCLMMINERIFISKLALRKIKGFKSLSKKEKNIRKIGILKELISRDQNDLHQYHRNMEVFTAGSGKADNLLNQRISDKEKVLNIKKDILKDLKSKVASKD